jgi:threonyl-tRNA synthetase
MRLLMFHVDSFTCTVTQRGRSPVIEEPTAPSMHIDDGILVLASAEAGDESAQSAVIAGSAREICTLATQVKARHVMLLPFAHLFGEPAPPTDAVNLIDGIATAVRAEGLEVQRPPFGWFHSWDLKAKGHPLSRVARRVPASPPQLPARNAP